MHLGILQVEWFDFENGVFPLLQLPSPSEGILFGRRLLTIQVGSGYKLAMTPTQAACTIKRHPQNHHTFASSLIPQKWVTFNDIWKQWAWKMTFPLGDTASQNGAKNVFFEEELVFGVDRIWEKILQSGALPDITGVKTASIEVVITKIIHYITRPFIGVKTPSTTSRIPLRTISRYSPINGEIQRPSFEKHRI